MARWFYRGYTLTTLVEYRVWESMISRCHRPANSGYKKYGAKGVTVCDRWRFGENATHPFVCFIEDMGRRPSDEYQLDRKENNIGYTKDNCQWLHKNEHYKKSVENRDKNHYIKINDRRQENG